MAPTEHSAVGASSHFWLFGWLGFGRGTTLQLKVDRSAIYSLSVPRVGLGLEGSDADDPTGAELCSLAPWEVSMLPDEGFMSPIGFASLAAPDAGGAELCSLAPIDLSGEPAWLDSSAARAGVRAMQTITAGQLRRRYILLSLEVLIEVENPPTV